MIEVRGEAQFDALPLVSRRLDGVDSCSYTLAVRFGKPRNVKGRSMKKVAAEPYREFDFSRAKRGPVVKPEPGKTKISIRFDNSILNYFRKVVDVSGGGSY